MEQNTNPTQETLDQWHNDPSNWKLGIFYFNKQDKRLFPPKRIKQLGSTVNFANPKSIMALFVLVAVIWMVIKFYKSM